ncbi:MAG: sigma-54-dependent transcriptional regulator [Bdellovibrionota bacterium]
MNDKLRLLVVDDDEQIRVALETILKKQGFLVDTFSNAMCAYLELQKENYALIISDQKMPEMTGKEFLRKVNSEYPEIPFIMITAFGTITDAVQAMQLGAADFITKPFDADSLLRIIERVLSPENKEFRTVRNAKKQKGKPIITNDPTMIKIFEIAEAVAKSDATVLIQGESGTGKELIARLIHTSSQRNNQPFVAVNCAALPDTLLESELFGHEKGAFTGALNRKIGKFELAQGGTILLDEVSEMDLALQAKLLRVLQEREIDRVGGTSPVSIDVRVLATTNRNLEESVRKGEFREDLFYRLNVIPITLPPLRDRKGDVKLLVEYFMSKYLNIKKPSIDKEILAALNAYPWPGNIRELQNAVQRASILSKGRKVRTSDFLLGKKNSLLQSKIEVLCYDDKCVDKYNDKYNTKNNVKDNIKDNIESMENIDRENIDKQLASDTLNKDASNKEFNKDELNQIEYVKEDCDSRSRLLIKSGMTVSEMEKVLILETLKSTENNKTKAADMLGISVRTLRNKLNEYNMSDV